jgi:hypothetical protein
VGFLPLRKLNHLILNKKKKERGMGCMIDGELKILNGLIEEETARLSLGGSDLLLHLVVLPLF